MQARWSLALFGVVLALPVQALADFQGECPVDQIGQPCTNQLPGTYAGNTPLFCAASLCETIVDEVNDAGEDVGVPATCAICGACVPFCSNDSQCPSGLTCKSEGKQGFGWGPPTNPDQLTLWFPSSYCTDFPDASPSESWTPSCGADVGSSEGDSGTPAPTVDGSSTVVSGSQGSPGTGSSRGGGGASSSLGFDAETSSPPPEAPDGWDGGGPSSADGVTVLRSNSCSFGPPRVPPIALAPLGAVLALLVVRRRSARSHGD